jgi:hypothetical protein
LKIIFPWARKKAHGKKHLCREELSAKEHFAVGHRRLTAKFLVTVSRSRLISFCRELLNFT